VAPVILREQGNIEITAVIGKFLLSATLPQSVFYLPDCHDCLPEANLVSGSPIYRSTDISQAQEHQLIPCIWGGKD
jgi:hypothetical protein